MCDAVCFKAVVVLLFVQELDGVPSAANFGSKKMDGRAPCGAAANQLLVSRDKV